MPPDFDEAYKLAVRWLAVTVGPEPYTHPVVLDFIGYRELSDLHHEYGSMRQQARARYEACCRKWEDEFIGSVSERVKTYGRAFADPEKGAPGQSLSAMQARKLKEIAAKAKGETPVRRWGRKPDR